MGYIMKMNETTYDQIERRINIPFRNKKNSYTQYNQKEYTINDNEIFIYYDTNEESNLDYFLFNIISNYNYEISPSQNKIFITLINECDKIQSIKNGINNSNNTDLYISEITIKSYNRCLYKLLSDYHYLINKTTYTQTQEYRILLHLLQFFLLEKIEVVSKATIFKIAYPYEDNHNINFHDLNKDKIKMKLPVLRRTELLGYYVNDEKAIYLCDENIFWFSQLDNVKQYETEAFYDAVLSHEIGHLIFSYIDNSKTPRKMQERRANYFSSYIFNSIYDSFINKITQNQLKEYENPLLLSHKLFNLNYEDEVNKLYEKEG